MLDEPSAAGSPSDGSERQPSPAVLARAPDPSPSDAVEAAAEADDRIERLAERLDLRFATPDLLRLAMTHRSVLQDVVEAGGDAAAMAVRTNERLEFLGDAMLGAVAAEYLYARDPAADEGALTRHRVALVRAETLVRWARELGLGDALYLGHGERPSEGARDRMLAGAFEAVVGAIAVDGGYAAARAFLLPFLDRDAALVIVGEDSVANPKGRLQEVLQERHRQGPRYVTVATDGPAHARVFTVEVRLGDRTLGTGRGGSKREAQQAAAADALRTLEGEAGDGRPVEPTVG